MMSLSERALERQLKDAMNPEMPFGLRQEAVSNAEALIGRDGFRKAILPTPQEKISQNGK